MILKKPRT